MNILNLETIKYPLNLSLDISIAMGHSIKDVEAAKTFFNQMFHGENDSITIEETSDYTDLKLTVKSPNELLLIAIWYAPEANTYNFKIPENAEDVLTFALDFTFGKFTLSLD